MLLGVFAIAVLLAWVGGFAWILYDMGTWGPGRDPCDGCDVCHEEAHRA